MDASGVEIIKRVFQIAPMFSNIYLRGSHLFGTEDDKSDLDLYVVTPPHSLRSEVQTLEKAVEQFQSMQQVDITVSSYNDFNDMLHNHDVAAVEVVTIPAATITRSFEPKFKLDHAMLRKSFSQVVSNSWVKAKKKLTVEKDYDERVARKSLYHSFRILDLGIQLATGNVPNPSAMNHILAEINSLPADWQVLDDTFRERHNEMQTTFRKVCPK